MRPARYGIVRTVAQLHVYDIFPRDPEHTVLVVRVVSGAVRVGDVVSAVRRSAGPPEPAHLVIESVVGAGGDVPELRTGVAGQITVTGEGRSAVQRGVVVETRQGAGEAGPGVSGVPPATVPVTGVAAGTEQQPELVVAEPAHLNRWTTFFRWLMLIPQWIFGMVYGFIAELVLVVGWFAALVLGRLPDGIRTVLGGYVGYSIRVNSYAFLLTDRYPPFGPEPAADYPVAVTIPPGTPLNRLAVFFRILLALPATLLTGLLVIGWHVVCVVTWLIVLISGRFPAALFDATAAIQRFQLRTAAYTWLLTPAYPKGLFADSPVGADGAVARPRRGGATALLIVFIVLGVLAYGGIAAGAALSGGPSVGTSEQAARNLIAAHDKLTSAVQTFQQEAAGCGQNQATQFDCLKSADGDFAEALSGFAADLTRIDFPHSEQGQADSLARTTQQFSGTLRDLSTAADPAAYQQISQQEDPAKVGNRFDEEYAALLGNLSG